MQTLFTTAYLAPVSHYALWLGADNPTLEAHCHYQKKTYRNRCTVMCANGPIDLSIPVIHSSKENAFIRDVRIGYDTAWQKQHWKTIESAYNRSPFFEFYRDDLELFFEKKETFLWDWNIKLMETIFQILGLRGSIATTTHYVSRNSEEIVDFRGLAIPKNKVQDSEIEWVAYRQVFAEKMDFHPNLSILDLLLNKGPESVVLLKSMLKNANLPNANHRR